MKTGLIFKIGVLLFTFTCFGTNAFGQEDFRLLRVSIDTNRAAYPPNQHPIIVEWTPITDTQFVRLDIHNTTNNVWSQFSPLSIVNDIFTRNIDTIDINDSPDIINAVNNIRPRKISVVRMVPDSTDPANPDVYKEEDAPFDGHRTIFLESNPDDCDEVITLSWNKSRWEDQGELVAYEIYESIGGGSFDKMHTINNNADPSISTKTFHQLNDIDLENIPSYLVRVVHTSGMEVFSNIHTPVVEFPGTPDYMISTHSQNNQNNISLFYDVDPSSELDSFVLKRATHPQGNYDEAVEIYEEDLDNFTAQFNIGDNDDLYYYKLFAYNKCGKARDSSNLNHPIILESTGKDKNTHHLEWTEYLGFDNQNGLSHYNIVGDTAIENLNTTSLSLNVADTLTIRVEAVEHNSDTAEGHVSLSNAITLEPEVQVYFKEAYRIGDPPVIGPTIENAALDYYEIKVFNRNGIMVYSNTIEETISEFDSHQKWNGQYKNSYVPPGTYIYHMIYSLPGSNKKHLKKDYFILVE